ncbi:MAG: ribosomal RNA small subunit methyltransferase A [Anaerolineae bacterium]|nr:ribosomal RNA small subunit methyltransferase A [Gemmatimonadaceae bacterium]
MEVSWKPLLVTQRDEGNGRAMRPRAKKSLGQHFLNDTRILGRIASAIGAGAGDTVIEVGPGRGALTDQLLRRGANVIGIELDGLLAARLRERYADERRVVIVESDVLKVQFGEIVSGEYFLAGNIPYYITTPILFQALGRPRPARAVYLVQLEVGQRIVAAPATNEYGALSVNVQALARAELLFRVPSGAFSPPPKVESAVIRVTPREDPVVDSSEEKQFREFVIGAFGLRRKQMRRVLRTLWNLGPETAEAILTRCAIDPERRPETLSPNEFATVLRSREQ